jgi:hypothetical protein
MKIHVRSPAIVGLTFVLLGAFPTQSRGLGGAIVAWGSNSDDQCNVPPPNCSFIQISTENCHSAARLYRITRSRVADLGWPSTISRAK